MKHLRIFENKDPQHMIDNAIKDYNVVADLIRDFIKFENPDMDIKDVYYYYYAHDLKEDGDKGLIVSYTDSMRKTNDEYVHLIYDSDFKKLYRFMEVPELYMSTNKYNI